MKGHFWTLVFLVTGNMVGVGLLAVPVLLGLAGFWPGLWAMAGVATLVWISGALLAERAIAHQQMEADLLSLYQLDLGNKVRRLVLPAYLLLFYALQVAYLTGGANTLAGLIPVPLPLNAWMGMVFVVASMGVLFGRATLLRWNGRVVLAMMVAFTVLLAVSSNHVQPALWKRAHWMLIPATLPVLCCTFAYHNVIPLVCREYQWNRRGIHLALTTGLLLAALMTALWFGVVVGTLPLAQATGVPSLLSAYNDGLPATVPLAQLLRRPVITATGLVFSLLAILTSYWAVGAALTSFLQDAAPVLRPPARKTWLFAATYLPPLLVALCYPDIFLDMVDMIGGIGLIVLFGLLPTLAFMRRRALGRPWPMTGLSLVLLFFLAIFAIEVGKEFRLLRVDPNLGLVPEPPRGEGQHSMDWLYELEEKMTPLKQKEHQ